MENPQENRLEECAHASYELGIAGLSPHTRFTLSKEQSFYGPGTHRLLRLTEETGSVLEACRQMGLSYSKGRKIIAHAEEELGFPLLDRQQGGKGGGRSFVTEEAKKLMYNYQEFCMEAEKSIDVLFKKYF